MVIRVEGEIYKVLEVESKAGAAKSGGVVKAKVSNVKATARGSLTSGLKNVWKRSNSQG